MCEASHPDLSISEWRSTFLIILIDVGISFVRYQGQTQLNKSKPSDFQMAIEEATLAEYGFEDQEDCPRIESKLNTSLANQGDTSEVANIHQGLRAHSEDHDVSINT